MFGSIPYIAILTSEHPDNPLKEPIGDKTVRKITEVIVDEFWREYLHLLNYSPYNGIAVQGLGVWRVDNNKLRKYIRECIKNMRKLRKLDSFGNENSLSTVKYNDLKVKLSYALKQLNEIRYIWIAAKEQHEKKKKAIKASDEQDYS